MPAGDVMEEAMTAAHAIVMALFPVRGPVIPAPELRHLDDRLLYDIGYLREEPLPPLRLASVRESDPWH